ncbi:MAG: amidase [Actinomycetota bacterium]|nr:amidase [Actinomycetota bacterium]
MLTVGPAPWRGDAREYLAGAAARIDALEPRVRAFTHLDRAAFDSPAFDSPAFDSPAFDAPATSSGPLAGMPIAVKEIIDVAGMPTTFGSALFADRVPDSDAESVARLRAAGAVVVGMTTTTPFACGTTTVTDNPRVPGHTPGGSSAGSGAAVGAGFVPVALASQSQASTLRPASYCGAWGFVPSHGRLPRGGMHLLSDTLDDLGVITASLAELTAVFGVLAEPRTTPMLRSNRPRIGVLGLDHGGLPSPRTSGALDALVRALSQHFSVDTGTPALVEVDVELAGSGHACFDLFAGESADVLAPLVAAGEPDPRLAEMVRHAATIGPSGVDRALVERARLRLVWQELAERHDVLLSLSTTNPAPHGHATTGCRRMPATASLLGVPALSAPWLTVDGRPQGVQLIGFEGHDEELLSAAAAIDAVLTPAAPTDLQEIP